MYTILYTILYQVVQALALCAEWHMFPVLEAVLPDLPAGGRMTSLTVSQDPVHQLLTILLIHSA